MKVILDFALAWRLLTAIPLPFIPDEPHPAPGRAAGYYPLVGLILGAVLAAAGWGLYTYLSSMLAAALLLALWVALTGMLHLDGFMDSCDGLLPPRDPARRLEIMKDSRVGAFGVVGVVLLLLIKFSALTSLSSAPWLSILVVPILARWGITWAMARYPLARKEGLSVLFSTALGRPQLIFASIVAAGAAIILLQWWGLILLAVAWLTVTLVARLAMARIGGLTGDIYGAICEVSETVLLVALIVIGDLAT